MNGSDMTIFLDTITECHSAMATLAATHPFWMAEYEDAMPFDTEPLQELLESAPNDFARGIIVGKLSILRDISTLTDRPA
jgi:hypothetical protein